MRTAKKLISVVLFLTVFLLSYQYISLVFQKKVGYDNRIDTFYRQKRDSLDVLFVGSSHVHHAIYPMQLWNEYGFTSFDVSSSSQSIPSSYYLIRDIIDRQHPKCIVLDAYYMVHDLYARSHARLHLVTDSMGLFNPNRYDAIFDLAPKTEGNNTVWDFVFPIAVYHSRWPELKEEDFTYGESFFKGANPSGHIYPINLYDYEHQEDSADIPLIPMEYLKKIIALCNEKGVDLLLVSIPYSVEEKDEEEIFRHYAVYSALESAATELGIPYLNLFRNMKEEIGIDADNDFHNVGHFNKYGAKKISNFVGNYLNSHYDLPDHRNEKETAEAWNLDYTQFETWLEHK